MKKRHASTVSPKLKDVTISCDDYSDKNSGRDNIAKGTWMGVLVREGFPEEVILTLLLNNGELFWEMRKTDWNV